ncbi:N-alpha-acetyltransferase 40 [Skeletonema marinoi]|uniref:N-alpha-acetyltransferase 40 n=1 Tax=Skeletonema marinoi TaxID=267567 RepID=A0AAD9DA88_9STRA|nr:N-alpha-acetyltransferase 40 [Skeletonema marinoi]
MAKSSKRRPNNTGSSAKKQLQQTLAHANAQSNPLAALPSAFQSVNIAQKHDTAGDDAPSKKNGTIHYYKSPLPESILQQCLDLFERNMGEMYKKSEWGLDMEEKRGELLHEDARFLIIILEDDTADNDAADADDNETATAAAAADSSSDDIIKNTISPKQPQQQEVIGFAHFRYEPDEDSPSSTPLSPITYLYELQISLTSHGLGKTLMTLIELLSLQLHMTKVILTVFKCNTGAMKFYLTKLKGYDVDECSPSNFEGGDDVEYEILSKRIGHKRV